MNKIGAVIVVVVMVAACYLLMLVVMPVVADLASTANITAAASSNMTNYPGSGEMLIATPWILWFVPATIGMIVIILILKRP